MMWLAVRGSRKAHAVMGASQGGKIVNFHCGAIERYSETMTGRGKEKCKKCLKKIAQVRREMRDAVR